MRKRVTNSLSQASTFQQVVSALDQTIEKHTEPKDKHLVGPTGNGTKQITSPNGEVHKVTTSNTYQNGPITTKITQIYSRKVVSETRKAASEEVEEISEADFEKSHYDATVVKMAVTAMTVVFLVGLVVFLETPPAADATIHRFMRSNVFVNTFDQYIYSPIRNVIVAGLSALWS